MAEEERSIIGTTRTFSTSKGILTYAQLSDEIAPCLLKLIDDIVDGKYHNDRLDENLIKKFHNEIIGQIIPEIAGNWRTEPVQVGSWIPAPSYEIPMLISEYFRTLNTRLEHSNTFELQIELLAYAEGELLHIHPFQDFNGRTVRAFLTELLCRLELPIIDLAVEQGSSKYQIYRNALAEYDLGRISPLVEFWKLRLTEAVALN